MACGIWYVWWLLPCVGTSFGMTLLGRCYVIELFLVVNSSIWLNLLFGLGMLVMILLLLFAVWVLFWVSSSVCLVILMVNCLVNLVLFSVDMNCVVVVFVVRICGVFVGCIFVILVRFGVLRMMLLMYIAALFGSRCLFIGGGFVLWRLV